MTTNASMLDAALWYARHGWAIFPLHTPTLGADGVCVGCSCGYRGDLTKHSTGKHPRTKKGVQDATTDEATVRRWWELWPEANIGAHCGASGFVALDLDSYKENYGGEQLLKNEDQETVTALTGGGGTHLLYAMPDGLKLGNQEGKLPDGVNVRGWGGYIVLPPSMHQSGRRYAWEEGYKPNQRALSPLPEHILTLLQPAQAAKGGQPGDLKRWSLPEKITHLIGRGDHSDRSKADWIVAKELVKAGATDQEIATIFHSHPIGTMGKLAAKNEHGETYLAATISKARADVEAEKDQAENQEDANPQEHHRATWVDYIRACDQMGYSFRLNELNDKPEVNGEMLTDVIEAQLLSRLHALGLGGADIARRAFITEAAQRRYHPVKEYLDGLTWDGQDHIAALSRYFEDGHDLISYADGSQRTVFHAWLLRWLVGSVARVREHAQNAMLVLDGKQDAGKSYFVKWLCPLDKLHIEGAIRPEDKDYFGYLSTKWVWEVSELGATMRRADREALKAFITLQDVTYRAAFGRYDVTKPALASFIGTVNFEGALLADTTGNRRFRPVEIVSIDQSYSQNIDVTQVWAQAGALYRSGERGRLTPEERIMHAIITETYEVEDPLEGYVRQVFRIAPENRSMFTLTTTIIDKLRTFAGLKENPKAAAMQLAPVMHKLGLRKHRDPKTDERGYLGITPKEQ